MTSIRKRKKEYKIRIIQLLLNPPTFNIGFGMENYTREPESKRNAKLIAGLFWRNIVKPTQHITKQSNE